MPAGMRRLSEESLRLIQKSHEFTERDCLQIVVNSRPTDRANGQEPNLRATASTVPTVILPMRPAMRLLVLLLAGVGSWVVSVEPAPGLPALLSQVAGVYKGAVLRMYNVELRFASHTQKPVTDQIRSVQF